MEEKFEIAEDESYRDPTNILRKLKKHEAAEKEMKANQVRIDRLTEVQYHIRSTVYYSSSNLVFCHDFVHFDDWILFG